MSFVEMLNKALNERADVVIDGETRSLTMKELIVEQLSERAAKGDRAALKALLTLREYVEDNSFECVVMILEGPDITV